MLKEVIPELLHVGVLRDAESQSGAIDFKEYEAAARTLKIQLQSLEVRGHNPDLEAAFHAAAKGRVGALIPVTNANLFLQQRRIADLAIKNRLPSMYGNRENVEAGGLMSYGQSNLDALRRAATIWTRSSKALNPAISPSSSRRSSSW